MKKISFLILFIISSNIFAEWTLVTFSAKDSVFFIDKETIVKNNSKRKFWVKTNTPNANTGDSKSSRTFNEVDCNDRTIAILSFTGFTEIDFLGEVTVSGKPSYVDHSFVPPDTINEALLEFVCK